MVDRATSWAEAVPHCLTMVADCAAAFIEGWVSHFGVPEVLTSDRRVQFTSELWRVLCHRLGLHHIKTTAYHPQANGMVERFHRRLKETLRARACGTDWDQHLPWVLLGLRSSPREDSGLSSAEVLFGAPLTLPGDFLGSAEPPPAVFLQRLRQPVDSPYQAPDLRGSGQFTSSHAVGCQVCVSAEGGQRFSFIFSLHGPFRSSAAGQQGFSHQHRRQGGDSGVDRLKPHLGFAPVQPAAPPSRGRPRKDVAVGSQPAANLVGGSVAAANVGSRPGENPRG